MTIRLILIVLWSVLFDCQDLWAAAPSPHTTRQHDGESIAEGFEKIVRHGYSLQLYGRTYQWEADGFLPKVLYSQGRPVLHDIELRISSEQGEKILSPKEIRWIEESPTAMVLEAVGKSNILNVRMIQRVEYDGVIDVNLELEPQPGSNITDVHVVGKIPRDKFSVVLGYAASGIRHQKRRRDVLVLPYTHGFLNAVNVGDGDRGIWWFADSAKGWISSGDSSTQLIDRGDHIELALHLVDVKRGQFTNRTKIRFGLLATPVKALPPSLRRQRVVIGEPSSDEQALGAKWKLWWPTAFAYDAYPYISYQDKDASKLSSLDRRNYPGFPHNRQLVESTRKSYGIEWIPYFSAHVLSDLDPELQKHREQWMVRPPKLFKDGLAPYSNDFSKPVLSHNADGYSDYVISRISHVIGELGAEGVYLDHGPPVDSDAPASGGWRDESGIWQASLDMFAERDFLRRLNSELHERGRSGVIFVHASNREITPAFTHAYAIIDGEQYRSDVIDGDYLALVSLAEFRARFAPSQSGILNYWLPGDWYVNRHSPKWQGSSRQLVAFRRVMALALLHDVALWPQGASLSERRRLFRLLDKFSVADAEFRGYWHDTAYVTTGPDELPVSVYLGTHTMLAVIVNPDRVNRAVKFSINDKYAECRNSQLIESMSDGLSRSAGRMVAEAQIDAGDFVLAAYSVEAACRLALLK